jgi:GntR family transcriptional regulator, transcriptional repressor for pyruvate dehydrogenase complex
MMTAWQRIRPVRASDEIVRQFRQALFDGHVNPGDPIGSEQQLAQDFGVSRTTVRDALRFLEASGLVEVRTGVKGGVRVARGDPERFADGLAVQLKLVGLDPLDALAAQAGLEWAAAELAAANSTKADLAEMERLLDEAEGLVDAGPAFTQVANAFHAAIVRSARNWAIEMNLRAIREVLHAHYLQTTTPERARRVVRTHAEIYQAIAHGEAARAGQLMRDHLGAVRSSSRKGRSTAAPACSGATAQAQ